MKRYKNFIAGCFLALCLSLSGAVAAAAQPATVIDEAVKALFGEFADTRDTLEDDYPALYALVDRVAGPLFDFDRIAKLVMGSSWKSASEAQRQAFATEFKRLLIVTYAAAMFRYTGDEFITFGATDIKEKQGRRFATVNTYVTLSSGVPISVVYSLLEKEGEGWKVYNLTVGELNLIVNYRNVIQASIRQQGLDRAIADLKANNDKNYNPG